MLKFGIVGTSSISHRFVQAAHASNNYRLHAIFSRNMETAMSFSTNYENVFLYTDWEKFLSSSIELVYIASPNSLHAKQAAAALKAGKHVIVEKPAVSTPNELKQLRKIATENKVFLFEAARNYHEHAITVIRDFLAKQTVLGAYFGYAKYSSKMPELLTGTIPTIFSSEFSGGALMDLGVYTLYAAIGLFGQPRTARYTAQKLVNTVDVNGTGQLIYDNFIATIQVGKNITSSLASEIYTTEGTLKLNSCQHIQSAVFQFHDGSSISLPLVPKEDNMIEEVQQFAHVIQTRNNELAEHWLDTATAVHQTLYTMRQDADILFKADSNEN